MSYALIDNASLTAIERACGEIVVKNPDTINGDLVAFENLVQAILFYDKLVCIDNYKAHHREKRIRKFDFIEFVDNNRFDLPEIHKIALSEAGHIKPEVRGGEFVDSTFRELIEKLKLNIVCTWDKSTSIYYLTMKMLGQPNTPEYEKYSDISSAIYNELSDMGGTDGYWSKDAKYVSSSGHHHTKHELRNKVNRLGGITKALEMFIASLNWLAYKTIYYSVAAKHFKADSFLHPIRHTYQMYWFQKTGAFGFDYTSRLTQSLSKRVSTVNSEIINHGRSAAISLDLPVFIAYLALRSGGIKNVIKSALELKNEQHFITARETIREIKIAFDEDGIKEGNAKITKLNRDLDKISGDIKRSYGVPSSQGIQGGFLIKSINSILNLSGIPSLPDREFAISTPSFVKSNSTKAFTTIFKDISNELISIERLGSVRDVLAKSYVIDDKYYTPPKTEDPKYRFYESDWKIPM